MTQAMQAIQVRSRLVGGVLFEYVPDRRVVRIGRRGLMFEVSLDQLAEVAATEDSGCHVLMLRPEPIAVVPSAAPVGGERSAGGPWNDI